MRMGKDNSALYALVFTFGFIFLGLYVLAYGDPRDWRQRKVAEQYGVELERAGLTVLEGIIQSPSVIVVVDNSLEFMITIEELQQDTVYYYPIYPSTDNAFYVFNDDMTIAWKYTPKGSN